MERKLMIVVMEQRNSIAVEIQKKLTEYGCSIKTRLGLHDVSETQCSSNGVIVLELIAENNEIENLKKSLEKIGKVKVQIIDISL